MQKKIMIYVVMLTMLTSFFNIASAFAVTGRKIYFYETFDNRGNSNRVSTMSFEPGTQEILIDGSDNKSVCIKLNSDTYKPFIYKKFQQPVTGNVVIEADITVKNLVPANKGYAHISIRSKDSGGNEKRLMSIYNLSDIRTAENKKIDFTITEGIYSKFSFAIDIVNCTYDMYVNGVLKANDVSFKPTGYEFNDISMLLFNTTDVTANSSTEYYVDNVKVYEGSEPLDNMTNELNWIAASGSNDIMSSSMMRLLSKDILAFYKGSERYIYNGSIFTNETAINSISDIPIEGLDSKHITTDKTGLTIISDNPATIDWRNNKAYLTALCSELIYDRPSGTELISTLKSKNLSHPRLMGDASDFERLKSEIAAGGKKAEWYKDLKNRADEYCNQKIRPFPSTVTETTSFIDNGIDLKEMAPCLALVYRIEGREKGYKYADRLAKELRAWADLDVWADYHMLGLGRAVNGIAFAYDWCFDIFDEIDTKLKTDIKNAVINNFYQAVKEDYYNIKPRNRSYEWSNKTIGDNWNTIINAGIISTAIVFGDEEGYGEEYAYLLDEAFNSLEFAFNQLAPDGAWYEGPAYWTPTAESMVWIQASLDKIYGTSFGFMDVPGMKEAPYYLYKMSSSSGIFNFNFAHYRGYICPSLMYYANAYDDSSLMQLCINHYDKFKGDYGAYEYQMTGDALLLSGDIPESTDINLPLDSYYRDTEAVTMRSSYDENKEFFVGFHSGYNGAQNAQLDIGTFVVEAYGDRFITDFGPEEYAIADATGNKFQAYMNRAEGANTYIVNPVKTVYMDQELEADCYFQSFETNDISAFAITDMTAAYGGKLSSAKRGIKMTNNRGSVILRDEIVCKEPSEIYWGMHTPAKVTLKDNNKTALLEIDGNYMEAKILSDDGSFVTMDAAPIDDVTFGPIAYETKHPGITKLAMHFENAGNLNITVCFTPLGTDVNKEIIYPYDIALDNWKLDELDVTEFSLNNGVANAVVNFNGSSKLHPKTLTIIIAAYNSSNELCDIETFDKAIVHGKNNLTVSFNQNFNSNEKKIKAFLIDMSDLKPYHTSIKSYE